MHLKGLLYIGVSNMPGEVGCTIYSFICLCAGAVEWESSCFATTLLHYAPPKVTSVLVLLSFLEVYFN